MLGMFEVLIVHSPIVTSIPRFILVQNVGQFPFHENLHAQLGTGLPGHFNKMRSQVTKARFEEDLKKLLTAFPKVEKYLVVLYKDRERWAMTFSPLTLCVSSWTNRVEGEHIACFTRASAGQCCTNVMRPLCLVECAHGLVKACIVDSQFCMV